MSKKNRSWWHSYTRITEGVQLDILLRIKPTKIQTRVIEKEGKSGGGIN